MKMAILVSSRALTSSTSLLIASAATCLVPETAFAIPSPELVVGSISSISQIFGLLIAALGGGATLLGVRAATSRTHTSAFARRAWPVTIGAVILGLALSIGGNYYQYTSQQKALQDRLEASLIRPTPLGPDGKPLDDAIREPTLADQFNSPHGMATSDVEKLIEAKKRGERDDILLFDIRESVEIEMGSPTGAVPLRFADIRRSKVNFTGKTAVLFCHNGIRSYDTCNRLAEMGIDCRFTIGGIEKWLVERRPLAGRNARTLKDLRAVPPYRNQAVLLDTPDVHRLVNEDKAIFVDARLPGEFAAGHLPGAVNVTLRQLAKEAIPAAINAVPKQPIIIPCYDRRSCFYSEALGLEFARAGYDFRGRYTVPWDYFIKPPMKPHVQQWLDELNQTWWDKGVVLLSGALRWTADHIGFLLSVLLLAALSRLLILPISWKAERDQIASRELAPQVAGLKAKLADDPRRRARAMRALYKRHGLTPVRNLIGLLFLPVLAICIAAVHQVATSGNESLWWMENAAERDPTFILPIVFAALICVYLDMAFVRTRMHRLLAWGIGLPVFGATGMLLSGAADLYVIASVILLLVQRAIVEGRVTRLILGWRRLRGQDWVVPLTDVEALATCGNKALRLGRLRAAGMAVPDGVVLTSRFLEHFATATPQWRHRELDRLWGELGAGRVAVRSSASGEDGAVTSYAGVFDSVLNVDRDHLEEAIAQVLTSFGSEKARSYGGARGANNILVQRMVDADYAGVLFTHDPASDGLALVELVRGTADKLVSGLVPADAFRFGRLSARPMDTAKTPIDLKPLIDIGRRAEELFGAPQDIEWTHEAGRFLLVQSRDITRAMDHGDGRADVQAEWRRILDLAAGASPDAVVFAQNEISEVLPRPTPLSLSLMQSLWSAGGSVDLACNALNLWYPIDDDSPQYPVTLFGRLYVDKRQERAKSLQISPLQARRLRQSAKTIETQFRNTFLPEFRSQVTLLEATNFEQLTTEALVDAMIRIRDNFVTRTHVEVDVVNVAANFFLQEAKKKLKGAKLDPLLYLAPAQRNAFEAGVSEAISAPVAERNALLTRNVGHRAELDYELAAPRYAEAPADMAVLWELPMSALDPASIDRELMSAGADQSVVRAVGIAARFETLKEDAKHHSLREVAVLRRAILALGRRVGLDGLVFYLTFEELRTLRSESPGELAALAAERKQRAAVLSKVSALPAKLTVVDLEELSAGLAPHAHSRERGIGGTRVSGTGVVEGRACVVRNADVDVGAAIPGFRDGDIVVSTMVPTTWMPYFRRAGGFVCEVGGWLSHTAIVARECNVPLIINVDGIDAISDGTMLRLHPNGTIEIVVEPAMAVAAE
jgi:rhodanese-related sulfurtransferase/membrane protein insertase Oxa1/YidC/SpoIIIJ/phosphohistidine swiveling domain-containing protein